MQVYKETCSLEKVFYKVVVEQQVHKNEEQLEQGEKQRDQMGKIFIAASSLDLF